MHSLLNFVASIKSLLTDGALGALHQLRLQLLKFRLLFGHGQVNGIAFFRLRQSQPFAELLLEVTVTHLLKDFGVAGFIHLESLAAVRADDVVHGV